MPTLARMLQPPPKDDSYEFEEICCDALRLKWKVDLHPHGRRGQIQKGVDIWGQDQVGRHVGAQCKLKGEGRFLTLEEVEDEVNKAETYVPALSRLTVATSTACDASLQEQVRNLSDQRNAVGKFRVDLHFWNEIWSALVTDPVIAEKHYPGLRQRHASLEATERVLSTVLKSRLFSSWAELSATTLRPQLPDWCIGDSPTLHRNLGACGSLGDVHPLVRDALADLDSAYEGLVQYWEDSRVIQSRNEPGMLVYDNRLAGPDTQARFADGQRKARFNDHAVGLLLLLSLRLNQLVDASEKVLQEDTPFQHYFETSYIGSTRLVSEPEAMAYLEQHPRPNP